MYVYFWHYCFTVAYCCYDYSAGTGNVSVGKFVGAICKLLGDANSQVSCGHGNHLQFYCHGNRSELVQ